MLVLAAVIGFGGAFISLAMSKWMAKNRLSVRIIDRRRTKGEAWLVDTIASHAQHSGTGMPEVGIFDSLEMDAFATGARRDDSLVAVSSAIHANIMSFSSVSVVGNALRLNRVRL